MVKKSVKPIEKKKVGRPDHYKQEMCAKLLKLMKLGASKTEVAAALEMANREVIDDYAEKYPEFRDALKRGLILSEGWWLKKGRKNIKNKDFNSTLWYMNMKNRFGWRDKTETNATLTVTHESALKELE